MSGFASYIRDDLPPPMSDTARGRRITYDVSLLDKPGMSSVLLGTTMRSARQRLSELRKQAAEKGLDIELRVGENPTYDADREPYKYRVWRVK